MTLLVPPTHRHLIKFSFILILGWKSSSLPGIS